jgi:hypothetical protein
MNKRTYILENKPKGLPVTTEMVKLLVPENETGYIPFANIQTSSFTAVNLVAYSANGALTITDPTPETNKGYIVHVVGGTTTIGGVGYTAGALVYRFYNGTVWTSKDYGAGASETAIYQNTNHNLTSDTALQKAFNVGSSGNGSFPILSGKTYKFEAKLLVNDESMLSTTDVNFGMIGDVSNCENISYTSLYSDGYNDNSVKTSVRKINTFAETVVCPFLLGNGYYFIKLKGTFSCNANGIITPAIALPVQAGGVVMEIGSFFEIKEFKTSNNVI